MKKKMRVFVFWPIFKIKIAIKTAEIGLEYLDNRSRLMSKMEALQEHPLRLVKFINQFPLFQYSSFNICERIDFAAKKQLSYEKEDAPFCILANFQDQNCNKNSRNWP